MTELFSQKQQTKLRQQLRRSMTKSETVLWKHIKGSQMGFKFRRQCGIGKYIVDFYCPELRLVVEVDGITHNEEKVFERDQVRDKYFASLGLSVKRYNSSRVFNFIREVLEDLYNTCVELDKRP
ncbi:MAG: endonuclease domain-containing protein [bacterium]|nr:endonuclease domain-containing protein [bacterium]